MAVLLASFNDEEELEAVLFYDGNEHIFNVRILQC